MSFDPWDLEYGADIENAVRIDFDSVVAGSEDAIKIDVGGQQEWIPRSQIGEMEKKGGVFSSKGWLMIPEWLAIDRGLA